MQRGAQGWRFGWRWRTFSLPLKPLAHILGAHVGSERTEAVLLALVPRAGVHARLVGALALAIVLVIPPLTLVPVACVHHPCRRPPDA